MKICMEIRDLLYFAERLSVYFRYSGRQCEKDYTK